MLAFKTFKSSEQFVTLSLLAFPEEGQQSYAVWLVICLFSQKSLSSQTITLKL
jgi:hypothetical protein